MSSDILLSAHFMMNITHFLARHLMTGLYKPILKLADVITIHENLQYTQDTL